MRIFRSVLVFLSLSLLGARAVAADPVPREPLTPAQIEELVSPIALYPDPLVALILPAATRPSDLVLAARFLEGGADPDRADAEPWDDSVKALARYPEVIDYLDENLAWTRSLGECFLDQPDDVMDAIQMVRVRAKAAGLLMDTSEQSVIVDNDEIRIVPAQPTIIYVPRYNPEVFYATSPVYYGGPFITFGIGYRVGSWLNYDCDWHSRVVHVVRRPAYWYNRPDWRSHYRDRPFGATAWTRWTPPPRHDRRFDHSTRRAEWVLHPSRTHSRDLPGQTRFNPPGSPSREANRPNNWQRPATPGSPRSRDWENRRRQNVASQPGNPVVDASPQVTPAPATPPPVVTRRPHSFAPSSPANASVQRERGDSSDSRRQNFRQQPAVSRPAAPVAPAVTPAPAPSSRPAADAAPAAARTESRDRPDRSDRRDRNDDGRRNQP